MGMHPIEVLVLVLIGMLIFGSQALQKWAQSAGKGVRQANALKDQVLSELPVKELAEVTNKIAQIPTSPQQVAARLLMPEPQKEQPEQVEPAQSE